MLRKERGLGTWRTHLRMILSVDGGTMPSLSSDGLRIVIEFREKQPGLYQRDVPVCIKYAGTVSRPSIFPNWLDEITCEVTRVIGWLYKIKTLPNSCRANLYEDGNDFV